MPEHENHSADDLFLGSQAPCDFLKQNCSQILRAQRVRDLNAALHEFERRLRAGDAIYAETSPQRLLIKRCHLKNHSKTVGIRLAERGLARHSARAVLLAGWAAGLLGMVWTAAVLPQSANYWWLVPGFVVMSIGQGASWTGMWVLVGNGIAPEQQGVASGVAATAQQVGAALGLAVLVMVAAAPLTGLHDAGDEAWRQANALGLQYAEWGAALLALLALLVCAAMAKPARATAGVASPV